MKQLDVPDEMKVAIDLSDGHVPESVKTFQPVLFRDGDAYCCVLGPDTEEGVVGSGKTPKEALKSWEKSLRERMKVNDKDDEVALYIQRIINPDGDGL